jgi:chorismate synthase
VDLADALVGQLTDQAHLRSGVRVGTTVGTPTTLQMIRQEAFKKS